MPTNLPTPASGHAICRVKCLVQTRQHRFCRGYRRRNDERERWIDGEREGERERERGFSSRDVNNDRNDRIRPRPLVFRVTSGRVTASLVALPKSSRKESSLLLLLLSPFSGPLFDCPTSSSSSSSSAFRWIVVDDSTRYERGGCAYLQRGPDLRRRMTHNRAIEANPVLPFRPCATSHPFSPHPRLVSLARSLARSPPPPPPSFFPRHGGDG